MVALINGDHAKIKHNKYILHHNKAERGALSQCTKYITAYD